MRPTTLCTLATVLASATAAAEPVLLGDLNDEPLNRYVADVASVGDAFVFAVISHDYELWHVEGPGNEATQVASVGSGSDVYSGFLQSAGRLVVFANMSDAADEAGGDVEVWVTDGTAAGTLSTEVEGERPIFAVEIGSRVVFWVEYPDPGLWSSDGTPGGSELLPTPTVGWAPQLRVNGGKGYFLGSDCGLWVTDGTAAGTFELVRPEDAGQDMSCQLGEASGQLVLASHDGTAAWLVDPIEGSATRADFLAGGGTYTDVGTFGAFIRDEQLWVTDNTEAGTVAVAAAADLLPSGELDQLPVVGGRVLFASQDGALWSSDGSMEGEEELIPAAEGELFSLPVAAGGFVYLRHEEMGPLFRTDGTAAGTTALADAAWESAWDFAPGSAGVAVATSEGLAFVDRASDAPVEVWQALDPHITGSINVWEMLDVGELVYIQATSFISGSESEPLLYRTDGTPAGTKEITSGEYDTLLGPFGDALFLSTGYEEPEYAYLDPSSDTPTPLPHDLPITDGGFWDQLVHGEGQTFLVRTVFLYEGEELKVRIVVARVDRDGVKTYADFVPTPNEGTRGSIGVEPDGVLAIRGPECTVWRVQPDGTVETADLPGCDAEDEHEGITLDNGTLLEFDDGLWASSDGNRVLLLDEGTFWDPIISLGASVALVGGGEQSLYVTDGTPEGTTRIEGVEGVGSLMEVRGRLVFISESDGKRTLFSLDNARNLQALTSTEDGAVQPRGGVAVAADHIVFEGFDRRTGVELYAVAITWEAGDAEMPPPEDVVDGPGDGESGSADDGCSGTGGSGSTPLSVALGLILVGLARRRSLAARATDRRRV